MHALPGEEERRTLGRCLHTLLFLVSGADGDASAREARAIEGALRGLEERFGPGHVDPGDLHPSSIQRARLASEGLGFHLQGEEIAQARRALDRMEPALRSAYEEFFARSCLAVASASADYLGLGPRINEDERIRLREIFLRLGFSSAETLLAVEE
jgi:tellurite resistance protein